jgi:2,4-dienoyl-CoA reductase-like NADH-dependent reductase (Old Yellow Enzyme family)
VTEGVLVGHPSAGHEPTVPRMALDAADDWRTVVWEVHAEGSAIMAQLWHLGSARESPEGYPAWTPSGVDERVRRTRTP